MQRPPSWHAPKWLEVLGRASWLAIGLILLFAAVVWVFAATRTIVVPLVLAALGAAVCLPLVDGLSRLRVPRALAALIVLLALLAVASAVVILVIVQIVDQAAELQRYLVEGLVQLQQSTLGPRVQTIVVETTKIMTDRWQQLVSGIAPFVADSVGAIVSLVFGIFIAINILLFYLLVDGRRAGTWLGAHIGLPQELGVAIVRDGVRSLRGYFAGATIVALFNGAVIGSAALVLGSPLVGVVALVNFLFSYIPYVGAIVGGAVAVLLALASGEPLNGLWMLVVVILMNTVLQTVVMSVAMGATLKLHPLVVLLSTTLGGVFAGAIGSALGAPCVAVALDSLHRVGESRIFAEEAAPAEAGGGGEERSSPEASADNTATAVEAANDDGSPTTPPS